MQYLNNLVPKQSSIQKSSTQIQYLYKLEPPNLVHCKIQYLKIQYTPKSKSFAVFFERSRTDRFRNSFILLFSFQQCTNVQTKIHEFLKANPLTVCLGKIYPDIERTLGINQQHNTLYVNVIRLSPGCPQPLEFYKIVPKLTNLPIHNLKCYSK